MSFPHTLASAAEVPAALAAFLRGIERRAAVFAALQCGDSAQGDHALATTIADFRETASPPPHAEAIADWPRLFWARLLASPVLRAEPLAPHWEGAFSPLARLGRGPRGAVLLRVVAGLDENTAASVLGIAVPTYRLALQRALPRREDGSADGEAWLALGDAARRAVRDLPPERLAALARRREAALVARAGAAARTHAAASARKADTPPRRGWLRWLWGGVALCALAFVASFWWPDPFAPRDGLPRIRSEPLPPAETPAARFDAATALLTEPDLDLLLDPDGERIARDVAFHAWLDARETQAAADAPGVPAPLPEDGADATPETGDAP